VLQTVPDAVHVLPEQHGRPSLPHDSQNPLVVQTWLLETVPHACPGPTHVVVAPWLSQHPPLLHWLPRQQASPKLPHGWHVVPEQTDVPPEHCSPSKTHVWSVGSQQPLWHAIPLVQHGPPVKPQLVPLDEEMPLEEEEMPLDDPVLVDVLGQVEEALPLIDAVAPPCVHVMVQLEPVVFEEHTMPLADSVPHRHNVAPFWVAVQHPELLPEQPGGIASTKTNRSPHPYRIDPAYPRRAWKAP
jgi:hypothetical protein